jgi:hypothetical protein
MVTLIGESLDALIDGLWVQVSLSDYIRLRASGQPLVVPI